MFEIESILTIKDVESFVQKYQNFTHRLTNKSNKTTVNRKELEHLSVAAWICKRNGVQPDDFIARIFRKHRNMEPGKIVRPHQLSTPFAEQVAYELSSNIEDNPYAQALLNKDVPLEDDPRYTSTIKLIESGYFVQGCDYTKNNILYSAERLRLKEGSLNPLFKNYCRKFKDDLGGFNE